MTVHEITEIIGVSCVALFCLTMCGCTVVIMWDILKRKK